jgi:hypothetical protein
MTSMKKCKFLIESKYYNRYWTKDVLIRLCTAELSQLGNISHISERLKNMPIKTMCDSLTQVPNNLKFSFWGLKKFAIAR